MPETFAEVEQREWSDAGLAASYARDFGQAAEICVPGLVAATDGAARVLDLCCGHGIVARGLVDQGATVTAADFSPAMLALAQERVPEAEFVRADAMNLPFADGTFDAITIGFGIPHVPDPPTVFSECARVLRPGGRLAYTVWHGDEKRTALAAVFSAIAEHGDPRVALPPGPGANDYAQPAIAFPALERAGFGHCGLQTVRSHWTSDSADAPFRLFLQGTARGGYLLRSQPADNSHAIRQAVMRWVMETCGEGPPWTIPIPAALVTAQRV